MFLPPTGAGCVWAPALPRDARLPAPEVQWGALPPQQTPCQPRHVSEVACEQTSAESGWDGAKENLRAIAHKVPEGGKVQWKRLGAATAVPAGMATDSCRWGSHQAGK